MSELLANHLAKYLYWLSEIRVENKRYRVTQLEIYYFITELLASVVLYEQTGLRDFSLLKLISMA